MGAQDPVNVVSDLQARSPMGQMNFTCLKGGSEGVRLTWGKFQLGHLLLMGSSGGIDLFVVSILIDEVELKTLVL